MSFQSDFSKAKREVGEMEKNNTLGEWSDGDDDWIWDIEENWDVEENVQTGRGKKRKRDDGANTSTELNDKIPKEKLYDIKEVHTVKAKKFRMTGTDYSIRFINTQNELNPIQQIERVHEIFERLLEDVTVNMQENDRIRFVLRSVQLDKPISLPFMPVQQLTSERVLSQIERVVQSKQEFRLDDTVSVNIIHVETPPSHTKK